jgi:hypothetical protein
MTVVLSLLSSVANLLTLQPSDFWPLASDLCPLTSDFCLLTSDF